jgi:hypothetical protein
MAINSVDPVRRFEIKGQVSQLKTAMLSGTVAINQQIVAAVSGSRIRVMGLMLQATTGAIGLVTLKSASGGGAISAPMWAPPNTNGAMVFWPIADSGYCETNTSEGLFADVGTATCYITIFYITYVP